MAIFILKPLWLEPQLRKTSNLVKQDYPGKLQVIFGVQDPYDRSCVVKSLMQNTPKDLSLSEQRTWRPQANPHMARERHPLWRQRRSGRADYPPGRRLAEPGVGASLSYRPEMAPVALAAWRSDTSGATSGCARPPDRLARPRSTRDTWRRSAADRRQPLADDSARRSGAAAASVVRCGRHVRRIVASWRCMSCAARRSGSPAGYVGSVTPRRPVATGRPGSTVGDGGGARRVRPLKFASRGNQAPTQTTPLVGTRLCGMGLGTRQLARATRQRDGDVDGRAANHPEVERPPKGGPASRRPPRRPDRQGRL